MRLKPFCIILLALFFIQQNMGISFEGQKKPKEKPEKAERIRIMEEKGPPGHQTIGIDESSIAKAKEYTLTFGYLMTWPYDPQNNQDPPPHIKKIDGQIVKITGFMFPLQEGKTIKNFCLLRTTQTCCYGPRPEYNQYVFVEMSKPTTFYRLDPVSCLGKFRVEPNPDEGYIYRLEGEACAQALPNSK